VELSNNALFWLCPKQMMMVQQRWKVPASVLALLICSLLVACGTKQPESKTKAAGMPPAMVTVAVAAQKSVPITLDAIGNAQPYRTVQMKSMVDGQVSRVLLRQGQYVRAGELLFQLDKRPFKAALDQAFGKLAEDKATVPTTGPKRLATSLWNAMA
jgi:multidrug efflux system membrane fusion protein